MTIDCSPSKLPTKTNGTGYDNPALLEDGLNNSEPCYGAILRTDSPPVDIGVSNGVVCNINGVTEKPLTINNGIVPVFPEKPAKPPLEYDPYQHRSCKNPTTYLDTMLHLLKASLGTGILAMPNAFQNAGYLVGTIGTFFIGFLCTYNIHSLLSAEYELCRRKKVPHMTFSVTVQSAFEEGPEKLRWFAPWGRFITNMFLLMYQIGSSSIYIVFISTNVHNVYAYYYGDISVRLIMVYLLPLFIVICWVRNLKLLVPFSTAANVVTILSFVLIFYYMLTDIPPLSLRKPVGSIHGMPLFFGTVLFAMEAIGVIMPLKNEMKTPEKFSSLFGVLNASMVPISVLYTFIGFFGYLKYGEETAPSITLNLPSDQVLAQSVKLLYSASIYITYALSCYVAFDIIWNNSMKEYVKGTNHKVLGEYVVRTGIVLTAFVMAIAIPNLDIFIALLGALCLSTMGVAFPAITQLLVFWSSYKSRLQFILSFTKNVTIIIIAVLAFVIGVSSSVLEIISRMD